MKHFRKFIGNKRFVSVALMLAVLTGLLSSGVQPASALHGSLPPTGLVCANDSPTITLVTRTGSIILPDGNMVYMWGYSLANQPFQHPAPTLCVTEGDQVTIVLHNTDLPDPTSIIFPGQKNVLANGKPTQPQYDTGGNLLSLAEMAAPGETVTYSFVAERPGTFLYESGTEPTKQVDMGLFGALIVRPLGNPTWAYNYSDTVFKESTEFLMLLSDLDPMLHVAVEQGQPYDLSHSKPRYWLINGRAFPDTVAPNGADWLPNQPYGALAHIHPLDEVLNPDPALVRYLNVGKESFPFHPHGNHGRIIGRDGYALKGEQNADLSYQDLSYEKFTVNIGPGQTYDATFYWKDVEKWHPTEPGKQIPVTIPQLQNMVYGTFFSGSPYLGNTDLLPVGTQALNACGEYYHIAHNHALNQITSWGVVLSGHITFTRIDPPLPNDCGQ
ncbi:MAG: copper oxidase [Chloroflexi bacterium]|nr:MAG: copper oxidase [Chloroflexota bacterium]